ncbi:unnamed protein product [Ascophyllum nodosum]
MERASFARVDSILAALNCPLCFEVVKDCVVTPCGHSFCRSCAGDAISRKHTCPVCQKAVIGGEAGLIRNFLVDEVTQALRKASDATDVAYMRLLFASAASSPASSAIRPPPIPNDKMDVRQEDEEGREIITSSADALSPIEAVLVGRMRDAFLGYQAYYERERAAHEAQVLSLSAQLEALERENLREGLHGELGENSAGERKAMALKAAIEDSRARFATGMEALLNDFDAHAAAAVPPPSLLPATVTVIVASRGVRFDTQLLPTHFPENVYDKVRSYYASTGDEVRGFGPGTRMHLQALSATRTCAGDSAQPPQTHPIDSLTQTVFSQSPGGRIGAGWAIVVDGAVLLASEEVKPCFAREFGQPGKDIGETVDYFTCGECNLNWLCAACATHCHRACRDVKPFSLNHRPTWACCYCKKKRARIGCKLADRAEGAAAS